MAAGVVTLSLATAVLLLLRRRSMRLQQEGAVAAAAATAAPCPPPPPEAPIKQVPPTEALIKEVVEGGAEQAPVCRPLSRTPSRVSLSDGQSRFGLDIGGSLLKLIYLELDDTHDDVVKSLKLLDQFSSVPGSARPSVSVDAAAASSVHAAWEGSAAHDGPPVASSSPLPARSSRSRGVLDPSLTVHVPALGGKLYFAHFATSEVEHAVEVLRQHRLTDGLDTIHATGGGAQKYREIFRSRLGVGLRPCNELDAVVLGLCLMVKAVPDECYTFERVADPAAAESAASEVAQPVVIPPTQLGISQPLRKIHKPFCAPPHRSPFLDAACGSARACITTRTCARTDASPDLRAPTRLRCVRVRRAQPTHAPTISSPFCCATWAPASPFSMSSPRRASRVFRVRRSAAAPSSASRDCSHGYSTSRTRSTRRRTATRDAST
jgi:hypothetical protein